MNHDDGDLILVDPTSELHREQRARLPRPASLQGLTVGIMDIHKAPGEIFLERLHELLTDRGIRVLRYSKPRFSYEAPVPVKQKIAEECDILIEGLAD
jgi:hypothetical protein